MSIAVALQDMSHHSHHESGTIRHRTASKTIEDASKVDPWINSPQDEATSKLPLESRSFEPTSVYWLSPHSSFARKIAILDLTKDMTVPYTGMSDEYKAEVKKTLKDHAFSPAISCNRNHWLGLKYDIVDNQDNHVAHWSHPWHSAGEATLTFPADSTHSPHNLSMKNKRWGLRTESFTLNSQPYFWEMDSLWHSTNMTLYRVTGTGESEKKVVVGKYAQKWWGAFVTGGTMVVDEKEVDGVVACLTLVVVLKKKRQRAAERNPGGGAGGSGG